MALEDGGEAGVRRRISRGELGSRRLVMLIFAGYPGRGRLWTYPHSFDSPQPFSNSLGDACSGWTHVQP